MDMPVEYLGSGSPDGTQLGRNTTTDKIGFYGTTPIVQRASSAQASSLIAATTSLTANMAAAIQEIMATMTALGLWKGSA
jgi:hypothetical protein